MGISSESSSRLMCLCLRTGFLLILLCAAAAAQACPPMPARARLKAMPVQELRELALQRWLNCGWKASEPVMRRWRNAAQEAWREEQRKEGPFFDKQVGLLNNGFALELTHLIRINPAEIDAALELSLDELDPNDDAAPSALVQPETDAQTRLGHYEAGVAQAVALLREDFAHSSRATLELELVLVRHETRQSRLDAARARLDRAEAAWRERAQDRDEIRSAQSDIDTLRQVLAPVVLQSSVPGDRGWKLYRDSERQFCGTAEWAERLYGVSYLRPYVLRTADPDAALAELLQKGWTGELYGDSRNTRQLAAMLRQRRSDTDLAQDWHDALASLRADDEVVGLTFQGRFLPLPATVVEAGETPGSTRERRLGAEELSEIVRATPLYRELHTTR